MAKKVVATLKKGSSTNLVKVIRSVRSPKTGAYTFKEEMMPTEEAQKVLARST